MPPRQVRDAGCSPERKFQIAVQPLHYLSALIKHNFQSESVVRFPVGAQPRENHSSEDVSRLLDILQRDNSALGKRD